jgi:hypothetical protein
MGRIKDLKDRYDFSIVDIAMKALGDDSGKYVGTFLKMAFDYNRRVDSEGFRQSMTAAYGGVVNGLTDEQLHLFANLSSFIGGKNLATAKEFINLNEKGYIRENDVLRYGSFKDMEQAVEEAQMRTAHNDIEKQTKYVYKGGNWLVVRPLTHLSSRKYGANTKWCTTMRENDTYFHTHTRDAILIYAVNRQTQEKWAFHKKGDALTVWDAESKTVPDSMMTGLPSDILAVVATELRTSKQSNYELLPDDLKDRPSTVSLNFNPYISISDRYGLVSNPRGNDAAATGLRGHEQRWVGSVDAYNTHIEDVSNGSDTARFEAVGGLTAADVRSFTGIDVEAELTRTLIEEINATRSIDFADLRPSGLCRE